MLAAAEIAAKAQVMAHGVRARARRHGAFRQA